MGPNQKVQVCEADVRGRQGNERLGGEESTEAKATSLVSTEGDQRYVGIKGEVNLRMERLNNVVRGAAYIRHTRRGERNQNMYEYEAILAANNDRGRKRETDSYKVV